MIVGRDTAHLEEPEILRAAIETVAENLSDAVIAPLLYLAIGGPIVTVTAPGFETSTTAGLVLVS